MIRGWKAMVQATSLIASDHSAHMQPLGAEEAR